MDALTHAATPRANRIYEDDRAFHALCELVLRGRREREIAVAFKETARRARPLIASQCEAVWA
jgi:hypothetical protein